MWAVGPYKPISQAKRVFSIHSRIIFTFSIALSSSIIEPSLSLCMFAQNSQISRSINLSRCAMAAAILQSLPAPHCRSLSTISSSPRAAFSQVSAALDVRSSRILPTFTGLRVSRRPPRFLAAAVSRRVGRRGSVVCEAQETAIEGIV